MKLARPVKKKVGRIRYNTKKLTESDLRDTFAIKLQNLSLYISKKAMTRRVKRVEQSRVQQAEIKLKSSGVRSRVPIWTHVKRYLENGKRQEESGYRRKHGRKSTRRKPPRTT